MKETMVDESEDFAVSCRKEAGDATKDDRDCDRGRGYAPQWLQLGLPKAAMAQLVRAQSEFALSLACAHLRGAS